MDIVKTFILIFFTCLLCSCDLKTGDKKRTDLIPNPEKFEHDNYSSEDVKFIPDSSINGISLHSDSLVISLLGDDYEKSINSNADIPYLLVFNTKTNQLLTLYQHPGGVKGEFAELEVSGFKEYDKRHAIQISDKEFVTESGIRLNMTVGDLKSIKGEPDTIIVKETTTLVYKLDKIDKSSFLERHNMPIYFADYEFKDGYLIRFKFGFEYP